MGKYDPVIGARIPRELMDRVDELPFSHSEIVINALEYYLEHVVNTSDVAVNKKKNE